jgi:hypothetical protein
MMTELPFKTGTYIDSISLDKFVEEYYGQEYSTARAFDEQVGSNGSLCYAEATDEPEEKYMSTDTLHDWLDFSGDPECSWISAADVSPHPSAILSDLAKKGVIPYGSYMIHVWW